MSVQDTTGSDIAFAAITHMGATVPPRLLRCILNSRDMVTLTTAHFQPQHRNGGILPPDLPGLGITVKRDALDEPVGTWGH